MLNLFFPMTSTFFFLTLSCLLLLWAVSGVMARRRNRLAVMPAARGTLMEIMADGVLVVNVAGEIVHANPAARRMLELPVGTPGGSALQVIPFWSELRDSLADDARTMAGSAGETLLVTITRLRNGDPQPRGTLLQLRDISREEGLSRELRETEERLAAARVQQESALCLELTHRKQQEEELSRVRDEAQVANRVKSMFLAVMSHELRTPLNTILGLSEMLQEGIMGGITGEQRNSLATIQESGQHLLTVVNEILDLTQIEADRMELVIVPVPVDGLCQSCLLFARKKAQRKRITVSLTLLQVPPLMQTDQRRLKQILLNLLGNAVKFTPEGKSIGLEVVGDAALRQVRFTVWDTGIGIEPGDREKLFHPFVQVDSRLSRQYEGTGLGLALVARLVGLMGGEVAVESEPGEGSRFTVTLPWGEES